MFQPKPEYLVTLDSISIRDFHEYPEEFVVRPPYQRRNVWSTKKQQALLDSLFRRYYVPRLVLREVRLAEDRTVKEVVDGQQRIVTVQRFFRDEVRLPESIASIDKRLVGMRYSELPVEVRKLVDKELKFDVDLINGVDNPRSAAHQRIATEIFWRLQQGESLNFMEIAHARLSSPIRNFLVKFADDIGFDYEAYRPIDTNPRKHPFFHLIERNNDRMQHLALLGRLLLIERAGGPADIRESVLAQLIDEDQKDGGVGDESFEKTAEARALLRTLDVFCQVFEDDPIVDERNGVKELSIEYFIISVVLLVDHLRKNYAFAEETYPLFRKFFYDFYQRWRNHSEEDRDVILFSDSRQQSQAEVETRDRVIRQLFFEFLDREGHTLNSLDKKRAFNEAERIRIYRSQEGLCQRCKAEGKPESEARVSWSQYQADHILAWIKGGPTVPWNGQVLCTFHNLSKGAS